MLELQNLTLAQGSFSLAANLTMEQGTRTAIIGPSGAGKSTLLMALAGFLKPASGQIIANGQNITNAAPSDRPLSILFQDNNLFPHMSVHQNVGLGLSSALKLSKDKELEIDRALERVGLAGFQNRKPAELSGGQQSRVALARVMVQRKPIILLDEPFAALGPALKVEMLDLVAQLCAQSGAMLLMVSHDPADARHLCDLTCVVTGGHVAPPQPTGDLLDNPPAALKEDLG
jgi:thiamine transport system ATP-binding protein